MIAKILVLALVAALCGGGVLIYRLGRTPVWEPSQLRSSLDGDVPASNTWSIGTFALSWDATARQLVVRDSEDPRREIWATVAGEGFVAAARGVESVREARGSFFVRDSRNSTYSRQVIDSIDHGDDSLIVRGHFTEDSAVRYELRFTAKSARALGFNLVLENANRAFLTYVSDPDERFYGFGEQFTYVDLKGRRVPIFVSEQGIGRGAQPITFLVNLVAQSGGSWQTTYAPVPHYLTNRMRSLFLENHEYSAFDLRKPDRVQVEVFASAMRGRILAGRTPVELVSEYTRFAGRMRPLPDWVLGGAIIGMQGGTERVREVHRQFRALGTPLAGYWLQDWVGQRTTMIGKQLWWNWELDREHYPDWVGLHAELAADGVRILSYFNPFLANVEATKPHFERNRFAEAAERGFLVREPSGAPYLLLNTDFSAGLLDLTNPDAWIWMKEVMREQVQATGVSGWMADFGEALPYDTTLHSGESTSTFHNRYPEEWARLNRELIQELGMEHEAVVFHRSAFTRSPRFATLFWAGDQNVTWDAHDGLQSSLIGLQSGGFSGFAFNHSDIGGYTTISSVIHNVHRSEELLLRWMEANAFTVVFRSHEGNDPEKNVQIYSNERTRRHFDRMARVYAAWAFYRKQLVREAAETGLPVVRHPFLHFPEDRTVQGLGGAQFLVGSELMVAPVLEAGTTEVRCYLPAGSWVHVWSGRTIEAGTVGRWESIAAPLGEPPVFYRSGSAVGARFVEALRAADLLPTHVR